MSAFVDALSRNEWTWQGRKVRPCVLPAQTHPSANDRERRERDRYAPSTTSR